MKTKRLGISLLTAGSLGLATASAAGVTYKDGDKYIKIGGRVQLQYHQEDQNGGTSMDEIRFRRLRPYIEGSVHKDWKGKIQFDFGKSTTSIKDAYFQYKGFKDVNLTIGNAKVAFSRENLTSSKKQQLVERTFVGDHNYGSLDRQPGFHLVKKNPDKFNWALTLGIASHDPDDKKLDFESAVSYDKGTDFSDGLVIGGRVELHPLGYRKAEQGDFKTKKNWYIGIGAFTWSNDDDNLVGTGSKNDLDSTTAFEISSGFKYRGFSIDAQYNSFDAELVTPGITSGIYKNSETSLDNWAIEGGYMIIPSRLEAVVGFQSQDADNYADEWTKTSLGLNYYVKKHDIKYQLTYEMGENKDGAAGTDVDDLYLQFQYVF